MKFRNLIANIISATIPDKRVRDIVRIKIQHWEYVKFCKQFALANICGIYHKIKLSTDSHARNLVILIDNMYVFKIPLSDNGYEQTMREKRIIDTLSKISPIKIPKMQIYQWGDITVRKYEYPNGVLLNEMPAHRVKNNQEKIATQLGQFLYTVGTCDPDDIRDLKPNANTTPGFLRGWFHNNITENCIVNPDNFDITYITDWENAAFVDFHYGLSHAKQKWARRGFDELIDCMMNTYSGLYQNSGKLY